MDRRHSLGSHPRPQPCWPLATQPLLPINGASPGPPQPTFSRPIFCARFQTMSSHATELVYLIPSSSLKHTLFASLSRSRSCNHRKHPYSYHSRERRGGERKSRSFTHGRRTRSYSHLALHSAFSTSLKRVQDLNNPKTTTPVTRSEAPDGSPTRPISSWRVIACVRETIEKLTRSNSHPSSSRAARAIYSILH